MQKIPNQALFNRLQTILIFCSEGRAEDAEKMAFLGHFLPKKTSKTGLKHFPGQKIFSEKIFVGEI